MKTFTIILVVAAVTASLRLLPVYVFGKEGKRLPRAVLFLSRVMPGAIISLLVVSSLKSTQLLAYPYGIPEALGVIVAAGLQTWRRNTLLSVFLSTACYMALIRLL